MFSLSCISERPSHAGQLTHVRLEILLKLFVTQDQGGIVGVYPTNKVSNAPPRQQVAETYQLDGVDFRRQRIQVSLGGSPA